MVTETAKITVSKTFSQPFWNIYNLINNRSNVPDPIDATGDRKFVYRRQPNFGRNFAGFPFIIVRGTKPTSGPGSANKSKIFKDYDNMIEVYAQDTDTKIMPNIEKKIKKYIKSKESINLNSETEKNTHNLNKLNHQIKSMRNILHLLTYISIFTICYVSIYKTINSD